MDWLESLTLGAVQGLTEFLPISSDGHLTISKHLFDHLRGRETDPEEMIFFFVVLHLGTLAAIVLHYLAVVRTGAKGLLGSEDVPPVYRRPAVIRVGLLAIVATVPLIPDKLFFMDWIKEAFKSPVWTGAGFLVTGAVLLVTLRLKGGSKGPAETTFLDALLIGVAQMFAPLPGVSRSGLTVAAGLALGLSPAWAVGFSLLMAVPAILGANIFELKDADLSTLTGDRIAQIVAATIVAGVIGYLAIIWLVKIVRSGRLWYFSVYLFLLGTALLVMTPATVRTRRVSDARGAEALDRPVRGAAERAAPGAPGG